MAHQHDPANSFRANISWQSDGSLLLRSSMPWSDDTGCVQDWLTDWADRAPDRLFLCERDRSGAAKWTGVTYGIAAERVRRLAAALAELGLGVHRPILILSGNSIDHQLLALAAMTVGVPFAPISVAYSTVADASAKLKYVLDLTNAGLVYADDGYVFERALTLPEMEQRTIVTSRRAELIKGAVSISELEKRGVNARGAHRSDGAAVLKFIFTSGSTGQPKGVITTHRMVRNNVKAIAEALDLAFEGMIAIDWLPWSHVFGGSFGVGLTLYNGGTLYVDDGRPLATEFSRTLENLNGISPTVLWNVPKAYEFLSLALSEDEELCRTFFADLRVMIYGAASLPLVVLERMNDLVTRYAPRRIPMIPAWGLTETTTIATIGTGPAHVSNGIGSPLPGTTIKLVPIADKHEALVKGPLVTPGYWKLPEVTKAAFDDEGYFKSGDAVRLVNEAAPDLGLAFEGRVAEDFKLLSGTWVNVTEVRAYYTEALAGLVSDVVVAGPDRDDLALLVFPLGSVDCNDPRYKSKLREALERANTERSGSSRIVKRAAILSDPPAAASGEITEKGSLNARRILTNRHADIDQIYGGRAEGLILQPSVTSRQ